MSADYAHLDDDNDIASPTHSSHTLDNLDPDGRASLSPSPSGIDAFFDDEYAATAAAAAAAADTAADRQSEEPNRAPTLSFSTGFFDHILNPAGLDHGRYSPFDWRPYRPLQPEMPPTTRAHPQGSPASQRPDRLANGYVDLTSAPDSPPRTRKRQSPTPGPSAKRRKREDGTAKEAKQQSVESVTVEEVDLTENSSVQQVLQKQREDAAKVQARPDETFTTFNSFNCVICMDNPTDLTATACGHLFCHTCLMEALIAGENRTGPHETKRSQCPVCRKTISRNKPSDVIPLLLKKGLLTQPRKKKTAAPAATASPKFCIRTPYLILRHILASSEKTTVPTSQVYTTHETDLQQCRMCVNPKGRLIHPKLTSQVAILGAGDVGATIAYSLIMDPVAGDILIVDPKEEVRDAQVQDLSDATFHGNTTTRIRSGTHKEAGQCDVIVITAGAKQKKGESRTDLIGRNKAILESAISDMKPFRPDTVLLLVANPVDVLTYFAQQFSGLPKQQVIGSGTFLDSARLRGILALKAEVAASSIDAYVLGEHGESQFVAWSLASIGETKNKATNIIQNKGATNYGIGGVTASICKSILFDQRSIRPVSHYQDDLDVCLSVPAVLGRKGIVRSVPMPLSSEEKELLEKSARALREVIEA
ncbi:hypothetical protein COCMIDRAFT_38590 [Bipolaris oryzae ATCC 44560]|uniref:RING-type domain-containing protein n=1 Tax=Bipolaris oryzae ATCC 44560 TaxID=930090 RepID=W6ZIP3_COCMI|nr:uncharacterized protein COCMIDRAFT_38590 [Bipolaris oryzae ATCC 44560]EUC43456.1 hypothetical protein COCMIDRAFT_38590 [Bipolaris oryzae ATCC 44560]